jgi:hypothetical protein
MRDRRELARLALALVEGSLTVGASADEMFIDAFESLEEAASAHAYLTGFVVQYLAAERGETVDQAVVRIRRLLDPAG